MNQPVVNHTRYELRVVLAVLCVLLLIECGMRSVEKYLSGSVEHILSIPDIVSQLDSKQADSKIIFLGNSLTNNAVDSGIMETQLSALSQSRVTTSKITPDGTALADWYCISENQIQLLNSMPGYLVIGYAWAQLSDQYPLNPSRLGGFFCTINNLRKLDETGLTNHQQMFRFLAGSGSHVYVNREAIRNRVLDMVIPDYQEITQELNQADNTRQSVADSTPTNYTYDVFERMIDTITTRGTHIILVSMPVIESYALDNKIKTITDRSNISFIDMRQPEPITPDMFKDSIHLNQNGQRVFSQLLAQHISEIMTTSSTIKPASKTKPLSTTK